MLQRTTVHAHRNSRFIKQRRPGGRTLLFGRVFQLGSLFRASRLCYCFFLRRAPRRVGAYHTILSRLGQAPLFLSLGCGSFNVGYLMEQRETLGSGCRLVWIYPVPGIDRRVCAQNGASGLFCIQKPAVGGVSRSVSWGVPVGFVGCSGRFRGVFRWVSWASTARTASEYRADPCVSSARVLSGAGDVAGWFAVYTSRPSGSEHRHTQATATRRNRYRDISSPTDRRAGTWHRSTRAARRCLRARRARLVAHVETWKAVNVRRWWWTNRDLMLVRPDLGVCECAL